MKQLELDLKRQRNPSIQTVGGVPLEIELEIGCLFISSHPL